MSNLQATGESAVQYQSIDCVGSRAVELIADAGWQTVLAADRQRLAFDVDIVLERTGPEDRLQLGAADGCLELAAGQVPLNFSVVVSGEKPYAQCDVVGVEAADFAISASGLQSALTRAGNLETVSVEPDATIPGACASGPALLFADRLNSVKIMALAAQIAMATTLSPNERSLGVRSSLELHMQTCDDDAAAITEPSVVALRTMWPAVDMEYPQVLTSGVSAIPYYSGSLLSVWFTKEWLAIDGTVDRRYEEELEHDAAGLRCYGEYSGSRQSSVSSLKPMTVWNVLEGMVAASGVMAADLRVPRGLVVR